MSNNSRHIPKKESDKVKQASGFRCVWDGAFLYERHHIHEFHLGGDHNAENLILLCPNCHTKVHKGEISTEELITRRKRLSGKVDRNSGNLSISNIKPLLIGKGKYNEVETIILYNDNQLLNVVQDIKSESLLISLKIFNRAGQLICWMNKNHWWLENESNYNFNWNNKTFEVRNEAEEIFIRVNQEEDHINIEGQVFINGYPFRFDQNGYLYEGEGSQSGSFKMSITPNKGAKYFEMSGMNSIFNFTTKSNNIISFGDGSAITWNINNEIWGEKVE